VEAAHLHADGLAPGGNGAPVLLEVVEAVVERGVPRARVATAEAPADSHLDVYLQRGRRQNSAMAATRCVQQPRSTMRRGFRKFFGVRIPSGRVALRRGRGNLGRRCVSQLVEEKHHEDGRRRCGLIAG
jgi:hypothetical protein